MKTTIENNFRVFQVVNSMMKQAFCNIEDLNQVVKELGNDKICIYQFFNNKPKKCTKRFLKSFFESHNLKQEFYY